MVLQISFRSTETFPFCQSHHESVGMGKYFLRMRTNQKLDCLLCQSLPLYSVTKIRAAMKTKSRHHHYVNFVKQCLTAQNCAITDWLFHKSVCAVLWNNFHVHKMSAINICKKNWDSGNSKGSLSLLIWKFILPFLTPAPNWLFSRHPMNWTDHCYWTNRQIKVKGIN